MSPCVCRFCAWKLRANWLEWFVAQLLMEANQFACERLDRELFLAAERDLDRMINTWMIDQRSV